MLRYEYKVKRFSSESSIVKWLNENEIKSEDIVSISSYCEDESYIPYFQVFYKELRK